MRGKILDKNTTLFRNPKINLHILLFDGIPLSSTHKSIEVTYSIRAAPCKTIDAGFFIKLNDTLL